MAIWLIGLFGCLPDLPDLEDPCIRWPEPGLFRVRVEPQDEKDRRPYVFVPDSEGPRDVVVLLHGAGMSGPKVAEVTGFQDLATEMGFVLIYPNGTGWPLRSWNAGPRNGSDGKHDDVFYLDTLVDEVSPKVCGDRVLAAGFSNGAMMAHRWGCEGGAPDAVASSSGSLLLDSCEGPPLPIRHYHGTNDAIVDPDGGEARGVVFPSVDEAMLIWRQRNECTDEDPAVTVRGDTSCAAWNCAASTVQCDVIGWPHQWPGGIHSDRTEANATGNIWNWFDGAVPVATEGIE